MRHDILNGLQISILPFCPLIMRARGLIETKLIYSRSKLNTLQGCPDPSQCQLLNVNRDTLFSFHEVSEKFLQQMVALYVAKSLQKLTRRFYN